MAKGKGASNLERLSNRNYFVEIIKSLMQGANGGFSLKFGEKFKMESLMFLDASILDHDHKMDSINFI
jgi:hypothetical protein